MTTHLEFALTIQSNLPVSDAIYRYENSLLSMLQKEVEDHFELELRRVHSNDTAQLRASAQVG